MCGVVQYMDKLVFVQLQGNRQVSGYVRGFDIFLNLVIDECREESAQDKPTSGQAVSRPIRASRPVFEGVPGEVSMRQVPWSGLLMLLCYVAGYPWCECNVD